MTYLEDVYGQTRKVKSISTDDESYIVVESFHQTQKVYKNEKNAIRAARRELAYTRSINGIVRNHFGFIRTRFSNQSN